MSLAEELEEQFSRSDDEWCGSAECPRGCAPRVALLARLAEMERRDADVRTLDEWAERNAGWWHTDTYLTPGLKGWTCMLETLERAALYSATCATPDEARAKAAAWVREQKQ